MNEDFMRRALELAKMGHPSPNPYVGAVIVKEGRIIAEGRHKKAGMTHAEVDALSGVDAKSATLYVTLEPCSHHGKTPPCTDAIIDAGITHVVYAMDDPTDKVRGHEILADAGIKVTKGVLQDEAQKLNEAFIKHSTTGLPFVTLKVAMTLDGNVATSTKKSKWITSEDARAHGRLLRGRTDAILVGIGTVLADDPQLTCRVRGEDDPLRVILDPKLRIPGNAKVFADGRLLVATTEEAEDDRVRMLKEKCDIMVCGKEKVDFEALLVELGSRNITSVLVEGGPTIISGFMEQELFDKLIIYIAPKVMGAGNRVAFQGKGIDGLDDAIQLRFESHESIGEDIVLAAYPSKSTDLT